MSGDVYDWAVDPDLWPQTLERIRATLGCACVMFGYADLSMPASDGIPIQKLRSTSWDATWFQGPERWLTRIPGIDAYWRGGVDVPWVQMDFFARIAPHIRRAVSINSMVDRSNLALTLYCQALDDLSVAVLIVDGGGRLVHANALADALLSKGDRMTCVCSLARSFPVSPTAHGRPSQKRSWIRGIATRVSIRPTN